jgi:peptide/nickel transport system substrate-binding protein
VSTLLLLALLAGPADTLVVGTTGDPVTLDPHRAVDLASAAVVSAVCEPLVRFRPDGTRVEPVLATTWATRDNRSWTFTLRQGIRFQDGAPFDAEAVLANIESLRAAQGFPGRAERIGPHAVSIVLDRPSAALLATLSQPFFGMQSPRALAATRRPVGTGPFRLVASQPGRVELSANPLYWAGAPRVGRVVFRRHASESALVAGLLSGEVDVMPSVPEERVAGLRLRPGIELDSKTGLNLVYLAVNNERPPFTERRVRRALAHAIDRRGIVAAVLGGHGEAARNPLPPSIWGYAPGTKEPRHDPEAARRLLAEARFPDGFETILLANTTPRPYLHAPLAVAQRVRDDLSRVGIRARVETVERWEEYRARGSRGEYEMAVFGWQADSTDPHDFLTALLGSASIDGSNRSRYRSAAMDRILKRGQTSTEPEARLAAYRQAQELFQEDMPMIPLCHAPVFTASRETVNGLQISPTGLLRYDKVWKSERP